MKILFIGTVAFSLKTLEKLISLNAEIVGVCTKENSNFNADFADLTPICKQNNIPFKFVEDINAQENIMWIKSLKPDIIFCFGWSSLIKKPLLSLPPMGIVGFHPASLPQNRGRHPIIWALALGLKRTSSTFFFMDEGADSGNILSKKDIIITYEDNANTLYSKIIQSALIQIESFIPLLVDNKYKRIPQDHTKANVWRKRGKKDGLIDFRMNSNTIYNLVRALTKPYVGAHIEYNGEDIIIWKVEESFFEEKNIESGKVLKVQENTILVKTYDGAIKILEHQFSRLPKVGEYL